MLALKEGVCSEEEGTVEEQRWETPGLWWKIKVRTTQGQEEATVKKKCWLIIFLSFYAFHILISLFYILILLF